MQDPDFKNLSGKILMENMPNGIGEKLEFTHTFGKCTSITSDTFPIRSIKYNDMRMYS